jgi:hypothetical protein
VLRVSRTVVAGVAVATALTVSVAGCGGKPASSTSSTSKSGSSSPATNTSSSATSSSASAQPGDYAKLLIQASDIDALAPPDFAFTGSPPTNNPNGQPGVTTTFSTQDGSHVIKDTIQVLTDPAAAANALNAAKGSQGNAVKDPTTLPFDVGTGGTTLSGKSPDNSKGVLILMFTEGKAFVTLEFDGPVEALPPPEFVKGVGQKQDDAIKKSLGG